MPCNGYRWWYIDAISDDAQEALTIIVFVGSVFSPYYAAARRHNGRVDPADHPAVNVALYRRKTRVWTFTERNRRQLVFGLDGTSLAVGPSRVAWREGALELALEEVAVPWPTRVRGRVRLESDAVLDTDYALDEFGRHLWRPIAPCARIEVEFTRPRMRWQGRGYLDSNRGERPLEADIRSWHWSRIELPDRRIAVFYDVASAVDTQRGHALHFAPDGRVEPISPPPRVDLPRTRWRVARSVRSEAGAAVMRTLEDSPFYARSLVQIRMGDELRSGVHESLDMGRFTRPWVQRLLPFRAPRRS